MIIYCRLQGTIGKKQRARKLLAQQWVDRIEALCDAGEEFMNQAIQILQQLPG
jgi:hypothetical protein